MKEINRVGLVAAGRFVYMWIHASYLQLTIISHQNILKLILHDWQVKIQPHRLCDDIRTT